jgi:hypothetical protein
MAMSVLTPAEALGAAIKAGWSNTPTSALKVNGEEYSPAEFITAIANAESGLQTNNVGIGQGADTEVSVGLTQLNTVGGAGDQSTWSVQQLTDPVTNFYVALQSYEANVKGGANALAAFQQPWAADIGAPGGPIGNTNEAGASVGYTNFLAGLAQVANVKPDYTEMPETEGASDLSHGGTSYTFSEIDSLIKSRGGNVAPLDSPGGFIPTSTGTSFWKSLLGPGGNASAGAGGEIQPAPGSVSTSPAGGAGTSASSAGGSLTSDIMRDVEVLAWVVGAGLGLLLSITKIAQGTVGVAVPGPGAEAAGAVVGASPSTPELWWVLGCASATVLWAVFTKQDPTCVFSHMTSGSAGSCAGTLQSGSAVEALLTALAAYKVLGSLGGTTTATGGGEGSEDDTGSDDETGAGAGEAGAETAAGSALSEAP